VRARITLAVVATLALALAIAGTVSILLLRSAAQSSARQTVLSQTRALVESTSTGRLHQLLETDQSASSEQLLQQVLQLVRAVTNATPSDLLVTSTGRLLEPSAGPALSSAQLRQLVRCGTVSGLEGGIAYAAVPLDCNLAGLSDSTSPGGGQSASASGSPTGIGAATGTGSATAVGSAAASSSVAGRSGPAVAASGAAGGGDPPAASGATGASTAPVPPIATIAIALSEPVTYSADSVWYFLLAAAVALVVAGIVAAQIARRVSRHVVAAAGAAEAIAGGDLEVRLSARDRGYPELVALGSAINTMAAGLGRARALERQFLLSISHDLRTPLTSIRGYAEAIADGAVPDPQAAANVVMAEAARLERLIRDLLDLAYLDAQRFSLHPVELDLGAAVAAATEALRYELETSAVGLEMRQPPEPLVVTADGDRIAQMVANLVENAGKYARSRVVVTVERRPASRAGTASVAVSVEDDGPGIAAEDLPHIFERLFTSEKRASRAARGTGLGLAIVAELAGAMGGSVSAESPLGAEGGTRMTVRLPLLKPPMAAGAPLAV
jgi:two-component system sensor histidine kinase BaeS